jgi:2-hydroxychromene-2-carboxylate isomerase
LAARVACRFPEAPWLPAYVRAVYRANFADDRDISDPAVISDCLACSGEDATALLKDSVTPDSKAELRAQTEEAVRLGIFGAPSFQVDGELFWGNDRLEDALTWAVEHAA